MKRFITILLLLILQFSSGTVMLLAQEKKKMPLKDSLDGALDLSYFLASVYGFLPFAMPITEPAVGYGAGFRYKLARLFGLYSGVDFAWGPDSWGFYLTFGHAWNRL